MLEERWKEKVDKDSKTCNEQRVRLEEHDKHQQKDIDEHEKLLSDIYDHKNNIYKKITLIEATKVSKKDYNALAKCVTQLKTEKKFFPWLVMGVSLVAAISSILFITYRVTRGTNVIRQPSSEITIDERLPVLRNKMPKDH